MIPVVIVHFGNQDYFQKVIEITSKKNTIFLIGDDMNKNIKNVRHIHYKELMTDDLLELSKNFLDFKADKCIEVLSDLRCNNNEKYDFLRYARVFFMRELMMREKIPWIFHIDSDCVLLEDVNTIDILKQETVILSKPFLTLEMDMIASIHNSLLNLEFCEKFIEMVSDTFIKKNIAHKMMEKYFGI